MPRFRRRSTGALLAALVASSAGACGGASSSTTAGAAGSRSGAEGRPIGAQTPAVRQATEAAAAAARRFATGYIALIYGRGRAQDVADAAPGLRSQLARNTGRIPPAQRGRRARVTTVKVASVNDDAAQATAMIDDGRLAPWPLAMTLRRAPGSGWQVTSLGE